MGWVKMRFIRVGWDDERIGCQKSALIDSLELDCAAFRQDRRNRLNSSHGLQKHDVQLF